MVAGRQCAAATVYRLHGDITREDERAIEEEAEEDDDDDDDGTEPAVTQRGSGGKAAAAAAAAAEETGAVDTCFEFWQGSGAAATEAVTSTLANAQAAAVRTGKPQHIKAGGGGGGGSGGGGDVLVVPIHDPPTDRMLGVVVLQCPAQTSAASAAASASAGAAGAAAGAAAAGAAAAAGIAAALGGVLEEEEDAAEQILSHLHKGNPRGREVLRRLHLVASCRLTQSNPELKARTVSVLESMIS